MGAMKEALSQLHAFYQTEKNTVGQGYPERSDLKVNFGELFPRVGFIVTNLSLPSRATHWTRLLCHRFRANEARLTYNLGNLWRRLVLPKRNRRLVADEFAAARSV